ncbi:MAG: hypothetical protein JNK05_39495 [Myxococcales bacterium]|nr:hypothetical protein [Myxococcales bacterium]
MTIEGKRFVDVLRAVEPSRSGALTLERIVDRTFHSDALDAMFHRESERPYTGR